MKKFVSGFVAGYGIGSIVSVCVIVADEGVSNIRSWDRTDWATIAAVAVAWPGFYAHLMKD